jgi:predicted nuclease of predicted toxin-antitoxin system
MSALRFALDEDVSHHLASLLRAHGYDADSAKELGRLRLTDAQALLRAAENSQTFITHNDGDFKSLHEAWVTWRRRWSIEIEEAMTRPVHLSQHSGILIAPHGNVHDLARIIEQFADFAESMDDRLFNWTHGRQALYLDPSSRLARTPVLAA